MFWFDNQRVLIVGGSSRIGFAAAAGFAEARASVTISARNLERPKHAAAQLGRGVQAAQLDVTGDKAVEQFFERGSSVAACRCEWFERTIRSGVEAAAFRCPDAVLQGAINVSLEVLFDIIFDAPCGSVRR
jgi:NAD(P)-dependent dehydrogenase (short-subunit alcohol dehydrogenase family)